MVRTYERFMCGDPGEAARQAARAIELGERLDVPAAVLIAQVATGRLSIALHEVDEGLAILDEVAVRLASGEVDPLTAGMAYCELICAAQGLGRIDLAREWTERMNGWRRQAGFGGLHGRCRVHQAELLRVAGPAARAEEEALAACDELRPWMRREFGWPLVELGNARLRRGDLVGAEEAYLAAHARAWCPQPGLALVRLAQGDPAAAAALVLDAIENPLDIPWKERPPFGDLRLVPLLAAQIEIAAATGDKATASRAVGLLSGIGDRFASPGLAAVVAVAQAKEALLRDDVAEALAAGARAVVAWGDLGAPYDLAAARVVLGQAHHRAGNHEPARMEWTAAQRGFEEFGAVLAATTTAALLSDPGPAERGVSQSVATFARVAGQRVIGFRGRETRRPDLKGYRYLERLLADPGHELHVLDLVAAERDPDAGPAPDVAEPGLPMLDDQARAAYRCRLAEVDEDIEEARALNDLGRLELAGRDREFLIAELTRAAGLAGRERTTGGSAERARTSVARSLRYALGRLAGEHPDLAAHLERTLRTGVFCSYRPDPLAPVEWRLESGARLA